MRGPYFALVAFLLVAAVCAGRVERIQNYMNDIVLPDEGMVFGVADRDPTGALYDPALWFVGAVSPQDHMRCGSVTKTFVTYALLKQQVNLNTKIEKFGFPRAQYTGSHKINVRDILQHTSGIPEFTCKLGWNETTNEFIPAVYGGRVNIDLGWAGSALNFEPGNKFSYSNTGFDLAGELVEIISGVNASIHLRRLFQVAAPSLHIDRGNLSAAAFPPTPTYEAYMFPPDLPRYAGSLLSRPADLMYGLNEIVRDRQVWRAMQDWNYPETPLWGNSNPCLYLVGGDAYGLGVQRYDMGRGEYMIGHEGDIGPRTVVTYHPGRDRIFMAHSTGFKPTTEFIAEFKHLVDLAN